MKVDAKIIDALNDVLTAELTVINQYYIHYKMCENWGYARLASHHREEAMEEMRHADRMIERILYLDGVPNMQRLYPVKVGEDAIEQLELMLEAELENVSRLNAAIALCRDLGDNGTRAMLEPGLHDEEESVDWLEAQLGMVKEVGRERYLAEMING